MRINTGYRIGPILKTAILEHIKRNGLTIVKNDDPIDWYKRTYCLQPARPKQRSFVYQGRQHQVQRIPVLAGQVS